MSIAGVLLLASACATPPRGPAVRALSGNAMMEAYLAARGRQLDHGFLAGVETAADWHRQRPHFKQQYLSMLGLAPRPPKTPLHPVVTRSLKGDGFVVEMVHFQSRPRLYVTANLYRPTRIKRGARLPAVLYLSGHSSRGRSGNKTAYQSHGIWFARHGYVALVLDSLQLGELAGTHHGTYRHRRWWWISRGYTPAGVECYNGIRAIDYLVSRAEVDPRRIAVTGISGGGAATIWIAAADERAKVVVPLSGFADLRSYVADKTVKGHCDCMFLHNVHRWPWMRILALVAPRPLLFANSDADRHYPMNSNRRVANQLRRLYGLLGHSKHVATLVSRGDHNYRRDLRRGIYRFINAHLKNDPRPVTDSEVALVRGKRPNLHHPIAVERLRVFPTDADLPRDQLNTRIDEHFVPMATANAPSEGQLAPWRTSIMRKLRSTAVPLPRPIPAAKPTPFVTKRGTQVLETEPGIRVVLERRRSGSRGAKRVLLWIKGPGDSASPQRSPAWLARPDDEAYALSTRGIGATAWTDTNPPNYVARSHLLLGQTVDAGRIRDIAATAHYLALQHPHARLLVAGRGGMAILGAYSALFEPSIDEVYLVDPPLTHMEQAAPPLMHVLRITDIPTILGLLAPKPVTISITGEATQASAGALALTRKLFMLAGATDALQITGAVVVR